MNSALIQLLVLAGVAIFLILRLRNVLGTREGFEKPPLPMPGRSGGRDSGRQDFEVIEGGPDHDITDHVDSSSDAATALADMKRIDRAFTVKGFLEGARGAYEMILMGFEKGNLGDIAPYLAQDVRDSFASVIAEREQQGLRIDASFIGVREVKLMDARFDRATSEAEITVRFVGELTSVVRNLRGEVVEGDPNEIKRQRDVWTFARTMGTDDPNWQLVATGV